VTGRIHASPEGGVNDRNAQRHRDVVSHDVPAEPLPLGPPGARCRFCGTELQHSFLDLGMSPLCQTHIEPHQLNLVEAFYPLHVWVCHGCFLVQLEEYVHPADVFTEYAYFSSYASTWLDHARLYADSVIRRFGLGDHSLVMEVGSNDGYLLQHFVRAGIPCLGIEPAANVAAEAIKRGVPTSVEFFGEDTAHEIARRSGKADLLVGNNVLAQQPHINDFVKGMKHALKFDGVITMEFPHLQRLIEGVQFDTIYHEHFSYFSFTTVERIFRHHGLVLFDVEELSTHGGSIRIYGRHVENALHPVSERVAQLRTREHTMGLDRIEGYLGFQGRVNEVKRQLLDLLIACKRADKRIVGYGAPGKAATLLNYCGIRTDFLDFTVDRNPHKQGRFTPGTHIPIVHPDRIREARPDFVLVLPWNLADEITTQLQFIRGWGGKFIIPIPHPVVA
jgi:hypothetical protein